jgi:PAS domain S-box-containing protein
MTSPADTPRDPTLQALRVSESRYRRLFETARDGILLLNADTAQIEDVNPYLIEMLGYSHAEFLGKKLWEVGPFSDRPESKEMFAELQANGYVRYEHLPLKTKTGTEIQVEFVSNTYDCEGIKVIQCNIRNISDRKEAEAKIQRLSQLYAALSQCNEDIVRCASEEELFPKLCRAAVQFGGMKMAWIGIANPDTRVFRIAASFGERADEYLRGIKLSEAADKSFEGGPASIALRDNRPVWHEDFPHTSLNAPWHERRTQFGWGASVSLPLHRKGVPVGVFTLYASDAGAFDEAARRLLNEMAMDISFALDNLTRASERKLADMELRTLSRAVEQSPASIVITDRAGNIDYVNPRFEQVTGYTRAEANGKNPRILKSGMNAPELYVQLWATISGGGEWRGELCNRRKNGELYWESAAISGVRGETGEIEHYIAVKEDITERKRLEEVHRQAQKLESLGTLASGISHDFNNILAAIQGNADLAIEDVGPDHIAMESLQQIRKASGRASELVRRIMAFGRPSEPHHKSADLSAVTGEVINLLRSTLPAGISMTMDFAKDTPHVLADAAQVHEVIVNLTTNAAYAIGPRAGSIEYRLEPMHVTNENASGVPGLKPGRYARLTVIDSGYGMDAAALEHIFDAFYTTKPVGVGTGLGLSMVYGIMKSHGGAVAVESSPGKGSRFHLYFPASEVLAFKEGARASAQSLLTAGQRVLYVDDEEALVFLAKRFLSRKGHSISGFTDPEKALEAFRAHPLDFDVVVTDVSMPHMSGFELARKVLALRPEIPVLVTTGYIRTEDEENARALGIRDLVLKPTNMNDLAQSLDRLFRASEPNG